MSQVDSLSYRSFDRGSCEKEVSRYMNQMFGSYPDIRKVWQHQGMGFACLGFKQSNDLFKYFDFDMLHKHFVIHKQDRGSIIFRTREVLDRYVKRKKIETESCKLSYKEKALHDERMNRLRKNLMDSEKEDMVRERLPHLWESDSKCVSLSLDELERNCLLSDEDKILVEDILCERESIYKGSQGDQSKCFVQDLEIVQKQTTSTNRVCGKWKLNKALENRPAKEVDREYLREYIDEEYLSS